MKDTVYVRVTWTASGSETLAFTRGASIDNATLMACIEQHALDKLRDNGDLVFDSIVIDEISDGREKPILNMEVKIK